MKKISIKKALDGKVWKALQFMIDGLETQSKRDDFVINMGTYGLSQGGVTCFGCAATSTIQEIAHKNLKVKSIDSVVDRAKFLGFDFDELNIFEHKVNQARMGRLYGLFYFFGKPEKYELSFNGRFDLKTYNWKQQIPEVKKLIKELKKLDL